MPTGYFVNTVGEIACLEYERMTAKCVFLPSGRREDIVIPQHGLWYAEDEAEKAFAHARDLLDKNRKQLQEKMDELAKAKYRVDSMYARLPKFAPGTKCRYNPGQSNTTYYVYGEIVQPDNSPGNIIVNVPSTVAPGGRRNLSIPATKLEIEGVDYDNRSEA